MRGIASILVVSVAVLIFGAQFILHPQANHMGHDQGSQPIADCVAVCLSAIPDTSMPVISATLFVIGLLFVLISSARLATVDRAVARSAAPVPLGRYVGTIVLRE